MSDSWDDDELPPRRRRNPVAAAVAVLVALAMLAGVVEIAFDRTTTRHATPAFVAPAEPATRTELDAAVASISRFVADARQLEFTRPVPVKLLDDAAFAKRVTDDAIRDEKSLLDTERVLRAVGLLPADISLRKVLGSFLAAGVVGFYDPKTDELVVRGTAITPYVRTTLAHELTHALDDQHFELDRPKLDKADDESGLAFSSLVEGNAMRIEAKYKASLTAGEQQQAAAEEARLGAGLDLSKIPRIVPELIGFPYVFGPGLLDALVGAGGERRVDAAFAAPPTTSEQVVRPDVWLSTGEAPAKVSPPPADGAVFDQGALGFWGVYLLLEAKEGAAGAMRAAQGWGGDWYVAWRKGASTCVRASFAMDTPDDLSELTSALDDWSASQGNARVTRAADRVGFTVCG